jgi:hypothetical protein
MRPVVSNNHHLKPLLQEQPSCSATRNPKHEAWLQYPKDPLTSSDKLSQLP